MVTMKPANHALKWGLFFTTTTLFWMVFEKGMGWHDEHIDRHASLTNLFAFVAIGIYVIALINARSALGGSMSWKQGFFAGFRISVVVALLAPLSQWITHTLISPEFFPNVIAYSVETGYATREEAEAFFNLRNYIIYSTIGAIIMGIITSALVALFVRRQPSAGQAPSHADT